MINEEDSKKIMLLNERFFTIFADKTVTLSLRASDIHAMVLFFLCFSSELEPLSKERIQLMKYAEGFANVLINSFPESKPVYEEFKKHIDFV